MAPALTIGQLAKAAGVHVETVRYYRRRGLLAQPDHRIGRIGRYVSSTLTRLRSIKRAQSLGFTLDDVRALLSLDDERGCSAARQIGERKLAEVRHRLQALRRLESALASLVDSCATPQGDVSCPLIDALSHEVADFSRSLDRDGADLATAHGSRHQKRCRMPSARLVESVPALAVTPPR